MGEERRHVGAHGVVWGVVLLALGVVFLLDHLGFFAAERIFHFWPTILIVVGVAKFIQRQSRVAGIILLFIGTVLQLNALNITRLSFGDLWPFVLILVGVVMIYSAIEGRKKLPATTTDVRTGLSDTVVFGGIERRITTKNFQGGKVTAVFGGIELDLSQAEIEGNETELQINAIFGGCEIRVPYHWGVVSQGQQMFGGYSDSTRQDVAPVGGDAAPPHKTLILTGAIIFGGVEIKN